jgi:hypothetical protein
MPFPEKRRIRNAIRNPQTIRMAVNPENVEKLIAVFMTKPP